MAIRRQRLANDISPLRGRPGELDLIRKCFHIERSISEQIKARAQLASLQLGKSVSWGDITRELIQAGLRL